MNVILSIKPQFVREIIAGRKKFEFRKKIFKQPVKKVYVYSSSPECRLVGEFEIGKIVQGTPVSVWNQTNKQSGITRSFYDIYFLNKTIAYALEIKTFRKYKTPVDPLSVINDFSPPQSYQYVEDLNLK